MILSNWLALKRAKHAILIFAFLVFVGIDALILNYGFHENVKFRTVACVGMGGTQLIFLGCLYNALKRRQDPIITSDRLLQREYVDI